MVSYELSGPGVVSSGLSEKGSFQGVADGILGEGVRAIALTLVFGFQKFRLTLNSV